MKIPLLIVGYERSGTTLLRRLISMHSGLNYELVHERSSLLLSMENATEAWQKMTYPATQQKKRTGSIMSVRSGQKIPYATYSQAKRCIDKFRELFHESYIMHIIRDPLETISSQVRTFHRNPHTCIKNYFSSVPLVYKYVCSIDNSYTICYENLVHKPKLALQSLYNWLDPDNAVVDAHIDKVLNTKDPWDANGRIMPGLRYFDSIVSTSRKIVLSKDVVAQVKSHKQCEYNFDF